MAEDWAVLESFFPENWAGLALENNAIKGLRKDKAVENYIRTLLIHIACGYSMRETATRAKLSGLADISMLRCLGVSEKPRIGCTVYVSHYSKSRELPCVLKTIFP